MINNYPIEANNGKDKMQKHNIDGLKVVIIGLGFAANVSVILLASMF